MEAQNLNHLSLSLTIIAMLCGITILLASTFTLTRLHRRPALVNRYKLAYYMRIVCMLAMPCALTTVSLPLTILLATQAVNQVFIAMKYLRTV